MMYIAPLSFFHGFLLILHLVMPAENHSDEMHHTDPEKDDIRGRLDELRPPQKPG